MEKLPKFPAEQALAEQLKTSDSLFAYEKLLLGNQIKKLRQKAKLKQAALAENLKTSQSVIARMESGKQNFTLKTLINIGFILGKKLFIRLQ